MLPAANLVLKNCTAQANNSGFAFSSINGLILDSCISVENTEAGLKLDIVDPINPTAFQAENVSVINSIFELNAEYGIFDNTASIDPTNLQAYSGNYSARNSVNYQGLPAGTPIQQWVLGTAPDAAFPGVTNLSVIKP